MIGAPGSAAVISSTGESIAGHSNRVMNPLNEKRNDCLSYEFDLGKVC